MNACATCKFWTKNGQLMECHRNPPIGSVVVTKQGASLITGWPTTQPTDQCGEYKLALIDAGAMPGVGRLTVEIAPEVQAILDAPPMRAG
jgi:hypothetical protein